MQRFDNTITIEGGEGMNKKLLLIVLMGIVGIGAVVVIVGSQNQKNEQLIKANLPASEATLPSLTPSQAVTGSEVTITVTQEGYSPKEVTVKQGTKLQWVNQSGALVTVHSDPHPMHTSYPLLNLGRLEQGKSVELIFDKAGTYTYHNHLNAGQGGTIIVE